MPCVKSQGIVFEQVEYDDGDRGDLHLAVERVRLLMHAGETFEPAKPAELEMLAKGLLTAANDKSATSPRTRKQCLSPSQEQQLKGQWQQQHTGIRTSFSQLYSRWHCLLP